MTSAAGESELEPKPATLLKELQGLEGAKFSARYVDIQEQAHDEAVRCSQPMRRAASRSR